jgi:predicted amidohydrolase YtcJ
MTLKRQVEVTPPPQWVRVIGGFTELQFVEKRLPTLAEINAIAPDTPVFILHLYDRALLNRAALRAVGYDRDTPNPPGGIIERDKSGEPTGLLLGKPNATILYSSLAKGPKLPVEYQINSTRHFMRELNRLGVTGVIDAGGGYQNYPEDYQVIQKLADGDELTVRIAYNLFTQKPGGELDDFSRWTELVQPGQGTDSYRHNGAGGDACVLCGRFRRLSRATTGVARSNGRAIGGGSASAGGKAMAVASACHLRRNDLARPRRVRKGQPRHAIRWPALVF